MTERLTLSYDSLVRFVDANAVVHRFASRPLEYAGEKYDGVLDSDAELVDQFTGGVAAGETLTLQINQGSATALRNVIAVSGLTGVQAMVRLMGEAVTQTGTVPWSHAKTLTIVAAELNPEGALITLQDIEDALLDKVYPSRSWDADTFRDIHEADAGMTIPYPVGTALKLRAALLSADVVNNYWHYGICDAPLLSLPIVAVNVGALRFSVAGDYTSRITAGTVLFSSTASANAGRYTVGSCTFDGVNTRVNVVEAFASATVSGHLLVPPTVLAVYRDGRLVAPSEYTVEMTWPALTQFADADFDNVPVDWSGIGTGTGTATLTGGVGRITGDGSTLNYGRFNASSIPVECQRGAHHVVTITLTTPGRVRMSTLGVGNVGTAVVSGQGAHTALVQEVPATGVRRVDLSGFNTGYSGTVDVDNIHINTTHRVLTLRFLKEQLDDRGQRYVIECDVRGVDDRNAATEIQRLLTSAGCTTDAASFATAAAAANTNKMVADIAYGRTGRNGGSGDARTIRAWLYDLLRLARASFFRTASGSYAIAQDVSGALPAPIDGAAGGRFVVSSFRRADRPGSVEIRYRPSGPDPSTLQAKIIKTVAGGTAGKVELIELPIVRDHETADRLATYTQQRLAYDARADIEWLDKTDGIVVGGLLALIDNRVYPGQRSWMIWKARPFPGGANLELREYDAAIYGYTPDPMPSDPPIAYEPDYSQTPPAAPTGLRITAAATMLSTGGSTLARVTVDALPPSVNWLSLMFAVIHNVTGEVFQVSGTDVGTGRRGTNIPNLRPGEVYQLKSWAVNAFGVTGFAQGTFDATAIGGGGAVTTFTTPGYATLPANVASCSAAQDMGRLIRVTWANVTTPNLAKYVLERKVGAGAFAEIARPNSTAHVDTDVIIGTAYQYRVRAMDTHGNLSASYATSGTVTPIGNINGGSSGNDIGSGTVDSVNRTGVTGISIVFNSTDEATMLATGVTLKTIAHALGKVPVIGGVANSSISHIIATASRPTSTTIDILLVGPTNFISGVIHIPATFSASYVRSELNSHRHKFDFNAVLNGDTATCYVW